MPLFWIGGMGLMGGIRFNINPINLINLINLINPINPLPPSMVKNQRRSTSISDPALANLR